ncbi:ABC transporter permease [Agrilactobacillus yilanensis]|uniref:ABC transporter permease n=1 Tax=Agrilactobacillus yilanensis TaxID=2485997 RepID=A0ABW4JA00_9LACO|nr:ABC transporter permease subunit [Agrilactobacillus yilanensis]
MLTKKKLILLLSPFTIFFCFVFVSAFIKSIVTSLGYYPLMGLKTLTFKYYMTALQDKTFLTTSLRTFCFALLSAGLACLGGLALALVLQRSTGPVGRFGFKLAQLPVMLPHIFVILALLQLLSQTGLVPSLLVHLGWLKGPQHFPLLVNDPLQIGIILTYLWKEIPFVIVSLMLVLRSLDRRYSAVGQNLGASKLQIFWHISLPMIQPALLNAFIINFSFNFGAYEVPYLLGNPRRELLPVYIYDFYVQGDLTQMPLIMSLNILLSLFAVLCAGAVLYLSRRLPGGHLGGLK